MDPHLSRLNPSGFARQARAAEVLGHAHHHLGVTAETCCSRWDGTGPDYGNMVEMLDWKQQPQA